MLFGPKHNIVEVSTIPRERAALQQLINEARARARRQRLVRWLTIGIALIACFVLFSSWPRASPASTASTAVHVYIPITYSNLTTEGIAYNE